MAQQPGLSRPLLRRVTLSIASDREGKDLKKLSAPLVGLGEASYLRNIIRKGKTMLLPIAGLLKLFDMMIKEKEVYLMP